jgi:hypothetical protein
MLKWVLFVMIGLAALGALMALVGMTLPKGHRASRTVVYHTSPDQVFATNYQFQAVSRMAVRCEIRRDAWR